MSDFLDRQDMVSAPELTYPGFAIDELRVALDRAEDPLRRLYALGFHQGAMVALGVDTAVRLRAAEALYFAERQDWETTAKWAATRTTFARAHIEEVVEACGVLSGYWWTTAELPDAEECWVCGRRIIPDLDEYEHCFDGYSCPRGCADGNHTSMCINETRADDVVED